MSKASEKKSSRINRDVEQLEDFTVCVKLIFISMMGLADAVSTFISVILLARIGFTNPLYYGGTVFRLVMRARNELGLAAMIVPVFTGRIITRALGDSATRWPRRLTVL